MLLEDVLACTVHMKIPGSCSLLEDVLACTVHMKIPGFARFLEVVLACTVYCSALHCSAGVVQVHCQWTAVDCTLLGAPINMRGF